MNNQNFKLFYLITPMTMVALMAALLFLSLTSCYVPQGSSSTYGPYSSRPDDGPMIEAVQASCYYNYTYGDYIWYFDAWIHYPRYDNEWIDDVYVEIYDGPYFIDSFPLRYDRERFWTSSWIEGIETDLWCGTHYEIDFIASDYYGNYDIITTSPHY